MVHAFVRDPLRFEGAYARLKSIFNSGGDMRRLFSFRHRLTSLIGPAKGEWRMAGANEHDYLHL